MTKIFGWTLLFAGTAGCAMAAIVAPEIDAASSVTAVTLLSGGLLVLRGRRKK